ncbi:MAG TPA: tetratricopeptide repeat protein [Flavobacterium sp.]|jgi:signal transduction histidine kinase|nr:tetratricopeptide repeat protein [Flavobacterium sp.]
MKSALLIFMLVVSVTAVAQNKRSIDSLNAIPFTTKTERAAVLDAVFLKNAADARRIRYKLGEAMSYSNLSIIYYYQGKYSLNVDYALKAISIFEQLKDYKKLAYEYGLLGYSMKRRNMSNAQYYMQKGKKIAESIRDTTSLLSIYNNYGVLKEMQNELDSALYFYKKGLAIKQAVNDTHGIPFSLNNIAGVYLLKKQFRDAENIYEIALAMRQKQNDGIGIAENYTYAGDLHLAKKDYQQALKFYNQALQQAQKYNYIDLMRNSYQHIASIYELLGNDKEAFENYKKFTQYKDSLVSSETNSKIAELEVLFETNNKEKQLIENKNLLLQKEAEVRNRNNVLIMLSLVSLFITVTGLMIFRQQKLRNKQQEQEHELKTAIIHIENQNKLQEQRLSISRDLHDNIGAQLTFIISSVENLKYAFDLKNTKLENRLQSINHFTKATIIELRDTIWAMNSNEITFEDLRIRIYNFIEKAKDATQEIDFAFNIADELNEMKLSSVVGMNIYRTIQEAVNNAVKYASAAEIAIDIAVLSDQIKITISDNGAGFNIADVQSGNGLNNMNKRVGDISGIFELTSNPGKGTAISIFLDRNSLVQGSQGTK